MNDEQVSKAIFWNENDNSSDVLNRSTHPNDTLIPLQKYVELRIGGFWAAYCITFLILLVGFGVYHSRMWKEVGGPKLNSRPLDDWNDWNVTPREFLPKFSDVYVIKQDSSVRPKKHSRWTQRRLENLRSTFASSYFRHKLRQPPLDVGDIPTPSSSQPVFPPADDDDELSFVSTQISSDSEDSCSRLSPEVPSSPLPLLHSSPVIPIVSETDAFRAFHDEEEEDSETEQFQRVIVERHDRRLLAVPVEVHPVPASSLSIDR
ncbi:unnamed protein product [Cyprideis torosa]|uniref:Uncharacterized protein n=1 Tax=Cyprideis torosa TaxID=163714 RepID=A0A7R8W4U9_9CRUS|nr:unnamed protein product [Cyprideis torosa]CAG0884470.1 unnamed protein product [Cyprideis torosa]